MSAVAAVRGFRPRSFNRNVRSFYLYGLSINAGMTLYWLLYNLYLLRLSYQEDFIGQMASMAPLATALLALPTGVLSDRLGRRPFLIASGLLLALSQVGLCLSTASTALLAFSFVGGVANAFIWVNHVPFLSDNAHPSRRAEAIVVWSAVQIVVRMLLSLVGGFLPGAMAWFLGTSTELPEPFRYALFLGAACSLVSVVPLLRIRRQPDTAPVPERDPDEGEDPRRPRGVFAVVAVTAGMRGFSMGLTYPFFNVFFEEEAAHRSGGDRRRVLPQPPRGPALHLQRAGPGAPLRRHPDDPGQPGGLRRSGGDHGRPRHPAGGAAHVPAGARR